MKKLQLEFPVYYLTLIFIYILSDSYKQKTRKFLFSKILNLSNFSPQIFQVELKEHLNYSGESQNHKNNPFHDEKTSY